MVLCVCLAWLGLVVWLVVGLVACLGLWLLGWLVGLCFFGSFLCFLGLVGWACLCGWLAGWLIG